MINNFRKPNPFQYVRLVVANVIFIFFHGTNSKSIISVTTKRICLLNYRAGIATRHFSIKGSKQNISHPLYEYQMNYSNLIFRMFQIRNINPHITQMHSDLKRFQCGYCGKRWKDVQNLKLHLTNHSSKDDLICVSKLPENDRTNSL